MKQNGFTLTELLGVLIILGVLLALIVPSINTSLKNAREGAYNKQIDTIESAAKKWGAENDVKLPDIGSQGIITIDFDTLMNSGYLQDSKIINPKTKEELTGCIKVSYDTEYNQYEYKYSDDTNECDMHNVNNKFGDINNDGNIDEFDLKILEDHVNGIKLLTDTKQKAVADLTSDSNIDKLDIFTLQAYLEGKCGTLPVWAYGTGDANDDGVVDQDDANLVLRYIGGYNVNINIINADFTKDGILDTSDVVKILRYIEGYE